MPPSDDEVRDFAEELRAAKRVWITTHIRPDGDALGTTAAMAIGLRRLGVDARCHVLSPIPEKYAFLYEGVEQASVEDLATADAFLVCDTGTWSQLPGLEPAVTAFAGRKLVLDHHLTQQDWANRKLVDTTAGAAAEVAFAVLKAMDVAIDKPIAERLYAATATDTGWFAYSNTSPRTLRIAADCVEAGADPDALFGRLYRSEREQKLRLAARGLASLELLCDGRLAVMSLAKEDYDASGAAVTDSEDLINEPMKIATVEASLLIGENPHADAVAERAVKVSLRSKGGVDCARLLEPFGGGGHARAAGARVDGPLSAAREQVVAAVANLLEDRSAP